MIGTPVKEVRDVIEITDGDVSYVSLEEYKKICERQGAEPDDLLIFAEANDIVNIVGCEKGGERGYLLVY